MLFFIVYRQAEPAKLPSLPVSVISDALLIQEPALSSKAA
jgi:hypothetical protein